MSVKLAHMGGGAFCLVEHRSRRGAPGCAHDWRCLLHAATLRLRYGKDGDPQSAGRPATLSLGFSRLLLRGCDLLPRNFLFRGQVVGFVEVGWPDRARLHLGGGGRRWRARIWELQRSGRVPGWWATADGNFYYDSFKSQGAMGPRQLMVKIGFFLDGDSWRRRGRLQGFHEGFRGFFAISFFGYSPLWSLAVSVFSVSSTYVSVRVRVLVCFPYLRIHICIIKKTFEEY